MNSMKRRSWKKSYPKHRSRNRSRVDAPVLPPDEVLPPELEPDPELELPAASVEPELDAVAADAPPSAPESSPVPSPPLWLPWLAPDDPQAKRTDKAAIGKRWRRPAARFINSAVAASGETRHATRGTPGGAETCRGLDHPSRFLLRDARKR